MRMFTITTLALVVCNYFYMHYFCTWYEPDDVLPTITQPVATPLEQPW